MEHSSNCINCGQPLHADQTFCDRCGQKTAVHRITVGYLFHEFFHAFTHADKGIFHLFKSLATNPGRVASEYVAGKRKKYFNPFTFLLICLGFMIFINNIVKPFPEAKVDPAILAKIPSEKGRKLYITTIERSNEATKFVSKNTNVLYMIALPFYSFIIWLFYRKRGRNFAEIVLALVFFTGFIGVVFTLIFTPLMASYRSPNNFLYFTLFGTLLIIAYHVWGMKNFLRFKSAKSYIPVFFVVFFAVFLWSVITGFITIWYMFRDKTFLALGAFWKQLTG